MTGRVLITGISGFVGPYLAKHLLEEGNEVWGLTRRKAVTTRVRGLQFLGIEDEVKILEGDTTSIASLAHALDRAEPEAVYHLAAQSYVPQSFSNPVETYWINVIGSINLLEAIRLKDMDPIILFSGSSEEYGLAFASEKQWKEEVAARGPIFPKPEELPELPIDEANPLRPMSPYGVSKVQADFAFRNYHRAYGMKTIVTRAFNHEGPGRGLAFVTSTIVNQAVRFKLGEARALTLGDVNTFRDWSHVEDVVRAYALMVAKGRWGHVYNLASQRCNSVLTYALIALDILGLHPKSVESLDGEKTVKDPLEISRDPMFGLSFERTHLDDEMLLQGLSFTLQDRGVLVRTEEGNVPIAFDPERYRPAEVPVLLGNAAGARNLGVEMVKGLRDIVQDQVNYFLEARNREAF